MEAIFLKLLNMSISAGWLILSVIVMRFLLKKIMPKNFRCILWTLVGIRLICPFSVESVLSLIPSAETVSPGIIYADVPKIGSGLSALDNVVNPAFEPLTPSDAGSVNPMQIVLFAASVIWIAGMAALLLHSVITCLRLRQKTAVSMKLRDNIFLCDEISSPFILGIFKPKIYLPSNISEHHLYYVSAHEKTHLKRHDNLWKPVGYALLTVYWFNPLVWAAYILFCRDIELACDERTIREMEIKDRKEYSKTLLLYSVPYSSISAYSIAFGEIGVKERIENVLKYKKPALWIVIIAIIICIAAGICFLTNPITVVDTSICNKEYIAEEIIYEDGRYSFTYTNNVLPIYTVNKDKVLFENKKIQGMLSEISLSKEMFDNCFYTTSFKDKMSIKLLRYNNAKTWKAYNEDDDSCFYILIQKNGDVYLAHGYLENEINSFRWIFKLAPYDKSRKQNENLANAETESTASANTINEGEAFNKQVSAVSKENKYTLNIGGRTAYAFSESYDENLGKRLYAMAQTIVFE